MRNIGKVVRSLRNSLPLDEVFEQVPDCRRSAFLPIQGILWLMVVMFACRRKYSLHAIDEYTRGLRLSELAALYRLVCPGHLGERVVHELRRKRQAKVPEPLVSDSYLSRVLCGVDPDQLRPLLGQMTMLWRRNKVWQGKQVVVYDATKETRSSEERCPHCRRGSAGWYHLGVHLTQVTAVPNVSMDYAPVPKNGSELTTAKEVARDQIRRSRGKYADVVVVDGLYVDAAFINMHREVGMEVIVRLQQRDPDKLPKDLTVFRYAQLLFEDQAGPNESFVDAGRNRQIRVWDVEGVPGWDGLDGQVRVLKFEFVNLTQGSSQVHWAIATVPKKKANSERIYHWTVARWRIENNTFRQEKTFEGLQHRQVHDRAGRGVQVFMILYLLAMNIVQYLAYRRFPTVRKRLMRTRYSLINFREDLVDCWVLWLYDSSRTIDLRSLAPP